MTNIFIWAWKEFYRWLSSEDMGEKLLGWAIVLIILLPILGFLFVFVLTNGIEFFFDTARETSIRRTFGV